MNTGESGQLKSDYLSKNGFEIHLLQGSLRFYHISKFVDGNVAVAKITAMSKFIQNYGAQDLREILQHLVKRNTDDDTFPRSEKALEFFSSDARRLAKDAWPKQQLQQCRGSRLSIHDQQRIINSARRCLKNDGFSRMLYPISYQN